MSRTNPGQVPANTVDLFGLSLCTATKSSSDVRAGSIYEPMNLAAAAPVFFHHLNANRFLALFSQRWTGSTFSTAHPGYGTGYTVDNTPSWVVVDATTGHVSLVGGTTPYIIPMQMAHDSRKLEAAASRSDYLYLLNTVTVGSVNTAVIQHLHRNPDTGLVQVIDEETIPTVTADSQTVRFNRGVYLGSPYLYFFGSGAADNAVYMARKAWAGIGSSAFFWEYYHGTGWSTDVSEMSTVIKIDGTNLTTVGPISVGLYSEQVWISTVQASGSARSSQLYKQTADLKWSSKGTPIALGTNGTTYLGGTYQLQSQVPANPDATITSNTSNATAFPALVFMKDTVSSTDTIKVMWSLWPVPRRV